MGSKSNKTNTSTTYGNTTTTNPYVTSKTNNSGTTSAFKPGTAFETIYNTVNAQMGSLLNEYLNPTLNSTTNQAKLNAFTNTLNTQTKKNLENNIINPLSNRNMIRSSQATDLYNNLAYNNNNAISNYANELLANSQENTAKMLNNLLSYYLNGYNVISNNQAQSLSTSQGNASTSQTSKSTGISTAEMLDLAIKAAMVGSGNPAGAA